MTPLCPFCGDSIEVKNACPRESCLEASARIPTTELDSRGIPQTRRGRASQPEAKRVRKQHMVRMLPRAHAGLVAAARREGITLADYLERIGLAQPLD